MSEKISSEQERPNFNEQRLVNSGEEKVTEYIERIASGEETITRIMQNLGPVFRTEIKRQLIEHIPRNCRNSDGAPFPYEILEEFLPQQTLTTNEGENKRNRNIRDAILFVLKEEQEKQRAAEQQIKDIRDRLQIPDSPTAQKPEKIEIETKGQIIPTKEIQLSKEIKRESEVVFFGDSNGSYQSVLEHLTNAGLIEENQGNINWKGGDKKVVFIGDILGDRSPEGMKIYSFLNKLKKEALKTKGNITWLSGNHENMFNAMLGGFETENGNSVERDLEKRLTDYRGNLELANYLNEEDKQEFFRDLIASKQTIISEIKRIVEIKTQKLSFIQSSKDIAKKDKDEYETSFNKLKDKFEETKKIFEKLERGDSVEINKILINIPDIPKTILVNLGKKILEKRSDIKRNINSTEEGKELMDAIKNQSLGEVIDDTLYIHTNLTKEIANLLINNQQQNETAGDVLKRLNSFYQETLQIYLSEDVDKINNLSNETKTKFNKIRNIFLSTNKESRINYSEDTSLNSDEQEKIKQKLKKMGINACIHGHNDEDGKPKGTRDLPILSVDRGVYKPEGKYEEEPIAHGFIDKEGKLKYH